MKNIERTLINCAIILKYKDDLLSGKLNEDNKNEELEEMDFSFSCGACTNIEIKFNKILVEGYRLTDLGKQIQNKDDEILIYHYLSMLFALDNPILEELSVPLMDYDCYPVGGEEEFDSCLYGRNEFWKNPKRFEFVEFVYKHLREYWLYGNIHIDDRLLIKVDEDVQ